MASRKKKSDGESLGPIDPAKLREVIGYLNFSSGNSEPAFLKNLNELWTAVPEVGKAAALAGVLLEGIKELQSEGAAFADTTQAEQVTRLTLLELAPAYRDFHADLLFHLSSEEFEAPFLLGRMFEAVLQQGPPWQEADRVLPAARDQLDEKTDGLL